MVRKQPSLFYNSHSEVVLGVGASHCSVRQGVNLWCISCTGESAAHSCLVALCKRTGGSFSLLSLCHCMSWCGVWKAACKLIWPQWQCEASQPVSDVLYCPFPI